MGTFTQQARILEHLAAGLPLTRHEAYLTLKIANPTARISELRRKGHHITMTWGHSRGKDGKSIKYGVWRLEQYGL